MSDIKFTYIIIKSIELLVFIFGGFFLSKSKTNIDYWKHAFYIILMYAISMGLRFGRMIDWNMYYFRYNNLGHSVKSEEYELLFEYICNIFYNIGIPYWGFIFLQCAFFMFAVLVFLKNYKFALPFILPLFIDVSWSNEQFIRWYISFSFLLLAMNSLFNGKRISSYCWMTCAFLSHAGIILFFPLLIFSNKLNTFTLSPVISILLLIIATTVIKLTDFLFITNITDLLYATNMGTHAKYGHYLNETEQLLSGEWGHTGYMKTSTFYKLRSFIVYAPIIYWGRDIMSKYKYGIFIYNLFILGAILNPLFSIIEIFNRYSIILLWFFCIVGGIVYYNLFKGYKFRFIVSIMLFMSLLCAIQPVISNIFGRDNNNEMLFIWDSEGRKHLYY